jgi:hypothetical protein
VSDFFIKLDHDYLNYIVHTCVAISFCSLHTSYGNHRAYCDFFKRKSIYIDAQGDQAQSYIFLVDCCC